MKNLKIVLYIKYNNDNIIILHIYNNHRVEFIIHNLLFMALYFALKI